MGKTSKKNHYIIILCGGSGPRLWPLSKADNPKQFLKLITRNTLIEDTINRAKSIVPAKNIFISSNIKYKNHLLKITKHSVPIKNIIFEPVKKNTALPIVNAAAEIYKIDPKAVITTMPSDHYIDNSRKLKACLQIAYNFCSNNQAFVALGTLADYANPSYGYLKIKSSPHAPYLVKNFIEKPKIPEAQKLLGSDCYWNLAIYTFSLNTLSIELQKRQPELYKNFEKIKTSSSKSISIKIFNESQPLQFEHAIIEKNDHLYLLPINFHWSDVGEWKNILSELKKDQNNIGNIGTSDLVTFLSKDCLVSSTPKKIIGLVGVENLAVIDTPNALLVCNLNNSFNVRDLVSLIVDNQKLKHYFLGKHDN